MWATRPGHQSRGRVEPRDGHLPADPAEEAAAGDVLAARGERAGGVGDGEPGGVHGLGERVDRRSARPARNRERAHRRRLPCGWPWRRPRQNDCRRRRASLPRRRPKRRAAATRNRADRAGTSDSRWTRRHRVRRAAPPGRAASRLVTRPSESAKARTWAAFARGAHGGHQILNLLGGADVRAVSQHDADARGQHADWDVVRPIAR